MKYVDADIDLKLGLDCDYVGKYIVVMVLNEGKYIGREKILSAIETYDYYAGFGSLCRKDEILSRFYKLQNFCDVADKMGLRG